MRRAAKRDGNEGPIILALRAHGWTVLQVGDEGMPDLLCMKNGIQRWLEVKMPGKGLTRAQVETFKAMGEAGIPVRVADNPVAALLAMNGDFRTHWSHFPVRSDAKPGRKSRPKLRIPRHLLKVSGV